MTMPNDSETATPPRISIITVVRNDADALRRTLASVARHKGLRSEYLIIDGASSDGTLQVAAEHSELIDRLLSEADHGIYDAMNKGMMLAQGDYLLFLNAGDELLLNPEELVDDSDRINVLIYGKANMCAPDGSLRWVQGKRLKSRYRFFKGMPLCHQAILYRRTTMLKFDTSFRIMADRVTTYLLLKRYGLGRSRFVDRSIVNYYEGGFSRSQPPLVWQEEEERFYKLADASWYSYRKKLNRLFRTYLRVPLQRLLRRA